jgi:hypothetical protein
MPSPSIFSKKLESQKVKNMAVLLLTHENKLSGQS